MILGSRYSLVVPLPEEPRGKNDVWLRVSCGAGEGYNSGSHVLKCVWHFTSASSCVLYITSLWDKGTVITSRSQVRKLNSKEGTWPWLVWFSGLSTSLWIWRLLVRFPVRAHAWVAGQVPPPGGVREATNHYFFHTSCFSPFLSPSCPLSKNK